MGYRISLTPIFAVDVATEIAIFEDGSRWPIETWYHEGRECPAELARSCVFQGPYALWFAVDLDQVHTPDVIH